MYSYTKKEMRLVALTIDMLCEAGIELVRVQDEQTRVGARFSKFLAKQTWDLSKKDRQHRIRQLFSRRFRSLRTDEKRLKDELRTGKGWREVEVTYTPDYVKGLMITYYRYLGIDYHNDRSLADHERQLNIPDPPRGLCPECKIQLDDVGHQAVGCRT